MIQVYINTKIMYWIETLTDLFCLEDNPPIVQLMPKWNRNKGHYRYSDHLIRIGSKNGVSLQTLVHEFLHATGHDHTWEINGWANFRSRTNLDNFSPLIVKDLTGQKELIL